MHEIIIFTWGKFQGGHHHIYADEIGQGDPNLFRTKALPTKNFSDGFASAVVLSGNWTFYKKIDFIEPYDKVLTDDDGNPVIDANGDQVMVPITLTPGVYKLISDEGLPLYDILSIKLEATAAEAVISEIILFDHINFQGSHHHLFATDQFDIHANLSNSWFNNITSSIIVKRGIWELYDGYECSAALFNILGPGMYSNVDVAGYFIDDISSLKRDSDCPEIKLNEIILFDHQQFGGKHHHIFTQDKDLTKSGISDKLYSIIVKSGRWAFYNEKNFASLYSTKSGDPIKLSKGRYDDISDEFVDLEAVSSVRQL